MAGKIQIRSFVKGGNHGQYLQALGLSEYIKQNFPKVLVSHLNYNNHVAKEIRVQIKTGHILKYLTLLFYWHKRFSFSNFKTEPILTVYGSDMIWHQGSKLFPPDPILFGKDDFSRFKISYAPSVASRGENEAEWIKERLLKFNAISVRDFNTKKFVFDHTGLEVPYVIDPCFLLLDSNYRNKLLAPKKGQFISVYAGNPDKMLKSFYSNLNDQSIPGFCLKSEITGYFRRRHFISSLPKQIRDPLWTVKTISQSNLLLTSTFHGVMIALMTETPFIAISSPNLDARLNSPISECYGAFRLMSVEDLELLTSEQLGHYLDFSDFNRDKLQSYHSSSREWLKNKLQELLHKS